MSSGEQLDFGLPILHTPEGSLELPHTTMGGIQFEQTEQGIYRPAVHDRTIESNRNKRFHAHVGSMILVASRTDGDLGVAIADLCNLKTMNDELGHQQGDEVLEAVDKMFRAIDQEGGRIGGDEFALAVRANNVELADIVQSLRSGFKKIKENNPNLLKVESEHALIRFGLAIGAVNYETSMTEGDLFARADEAMYIDKNNAIPDLSPEQIEKLYSIYDTAEELGTSIRGLNSLANKYPRPNLVTTKNGA